MRDTGWAIHVLGIVLIDAVPVYPRRFIAEEVGDVDRDSIADLGHDFGTWPSPVDADD